MIRGDDPSLGNAALPFRHDEAYSNFYKLAREEVENSDSSVVYLHCPKWKVFADFEGRLKIAPGIGFLTDPETNKIIGREGFGGIVPYTRYRLIYTGVSNVEAVERELRNPMKEPQNGSEPELIPDVGDGR